MCNIVLDSTGTAVNNDASNLVGCASFIIPGLGSPRAAKGAINLFKEDVNATFKIQNVITLDRPIAPPTTGRAWQAITRY